MRIYIAMLIIWTVSSVAEPSNLLIRASEEARSSLPIFWEIFEAEGEDPYAFELKAKVTLSDGLTTTAWIGKLKRLEGGYIEGSIMRKPDRLEYHSKFNSVVKFTSADVLDWGCRYEIEQSSKLFGHFTTRLMMPTMRTRDQELWKNALSKMPLPLRTESK